MLPQRNAHLPKRNPNTKWFSKHLCNKFAALPCPSTCLQITLSRPLSPHQALIPTKASHKWTKFQKNPTYFQQGLIISITWLNYDKHLFTILKLNAIICWLRLCCIGYIHLLLSWYYALVKKKYQICVIFFFFIKQNQTKNKGMILCVKGC